MNTYRLEPKKPFSRDQVLKIIEEIVNKECTGLQYDPVKCPNLALNIASQIRLKVKELEFDRYVLPFTKKKIFPTKSTANH